jgi:hypothetical protein
MVHQFQLEFEDTLHDFRRLLLQNAFLCLLNGCFFVFLERFVECVQIVVKYRYNVLAEMVAAEKTLEVKKSAVKQDMTEIANAEQVASAATANYERVNCCFKEEMSRFEATKGKEISKSVARLGKMLVTYHLKAADSYRSLII